MPRDQKGIRINVWIQSNKRFGPVSDRKVCNHNGGYSIDVQVQSVFQDQTVSWIRIVNGIGKFVKEAMPIQQEEKASVRNDAKARPIFKPSSATGWDFTLIEQRQWIDIETQESNDPYWFQVSKFITRLLRHGQKVQREDDGAVRYDLVIDECKNKQFDNTEYWSVETKKHFVNAQNWSVDKWISVLAKGGGQKRRVSILLESELSSSIPVPSSNPRVLLPEGFFPILFITSKTKKD